MYIMDISEQCGYSIEQQIELFENIKPLFTKKPLVVALNKVDIIRPEELGEDGRAVLAKFEREDVLVLPMSTVTEEGITDLKTQACDLLLAQRVEVKMKGKKMPDVLNRLHVAMPTPRDQTERLPFIPPGAEVTDKEQQYDIIPEIFEGKNVADYIDPDILQQLEELEREEEMREQAGVYDSEPEDEETLRTREIAVAIRKKRTLIQKQRWAKRSRNCPVVPRSKGPAVRPSRPRKRKGEEEEEGMEVVGSGGEESGEDGKSTIIMALHMYM